MTSPSTATSPIPSHQNRELQALLYRKQILANARILWGFHQNYELLQDTSDTSIFDSAFNSDSDPADAAENPELLIRDSIHLVSCPWTPLVGTTAVVLRTYLHCSPAYDPIFLEPLRLLNARLAADVHEAMGKGRFGVGFERVVQLDGIVDLVEEDE